MEEKNVIIVPRKYTVGECCVWGYRCALGWIGPCCHKPCSNTLCVKAKKEKSVFYPKYCPDATCIIMMRCERAGVLLLRKYKTFKPTKNNKL